jgi:(p)ppGpp synthase/HD superfamily hydrolase
MADDPLSPPADKVPAFVRSDPLLHDAYELAYAAHHGPRRRGETNIDHPVSVAELLASQGFEREIVAAALLHDVVEDTDTDPQELSERFGTPVSELVREMTEDQSIPSYEERKAEHRSRMARSRSVAAIYAADKLANLRDMRRLYAEVGERAAERFTAPLELRARLWLEDAALAERVLPDSELARELSAEARGFAADRSASLVGRSSAGDG